MTISKLGGAVACFIVFAGVAVAMGVSARKDRREGRREQDRVTMFFAVQEWWPAVIAPLVAIVGPVVILAQR